jgi:hypothetical protein
MLISDWFVSHHPCLHLPSKTFVGGTILQRLNREIGSAPSYNMERQVVPASQADGQLG